MRDVFSTTFLSNLKVLNFLCIDQGWHLSFSMHSFFSRIFSRISSLVRCWLSSSPSSRFKKGSCSLQAAKQQLYDVSIKTGIDCSRNGCNFPATLFIEGLSVSQCCNEATIKVELSEVQILSSIRLILPRLGGFHVCFLLPTWAPPQQKHQVKNGPPATASSAANIVGSVARGLPTVHFAYLLERSRIGAVRLQFDWI